MERKEVKTILMYYSEIPGMIKLLKREKYELELEYSSIQGMSSDGSQHGNGPGTPTEQIAIRMIENGNSNRLKEIEIQLQVLDRDAALIRGCVDGMNSKYKRVLLLRSVNGYSWGRICAQTGIPESTARDWHNKAQERIGKELEYVPMAEELYYRALRAR